MEILLQAVPPWQKDHAAAMDRGAWRYARLPELLGKGEHECVAEHRALTVDPGWLQPGRLGEVDAESVALALVAAGHLGTGVAEMFLDVTLIDIC